MGEEYGETAPFLYFVSHHDSALVEAVRQGRRDEFSRFTWNGEVPDPQAEATFQQSKLNPAVAAHGPGTGLAAALPNSDRPTKDRPGFALPVDRLGTGVTVDQFERMLDIRRGRTWFERRILYHLGDVGIEHRLTWPEGRWRKICDSADICWEGPGATLPDGSLDW